MHHTLVLGIGNILFCDEGVGIHVLQYLQRRHPFLPGVRYLDGGTLSFTLSEEISESKNLIVIDAAQLNEAPGTIRCFEGPRMDCFLGANGRSVHEVGLTDLLDIARLEGCLAENRALLGIQPHKLDWGETPTDLVARIVPNAAEKVFSILERWELDVGAMGCD